MPRRCVPIELPDGTVAYGMASGPLTEEDRRAVLEFYETLKIRRAVTGCTCPHGNDRPLPDHWRECEAKEVDDAPQEGSVQEGDQ